MTGSIEEAESPQVAIIRETSEEIGIELTDSPKLVTTIFLTEKDFLYPSKKLYILEMFFLSDLPQGQNPENREPLKQDALGWFSPNKLPSPMIPGVKFGLECFFRGENYGELHNI